MAAMSNPAFNSPAFQLNQSSAALNKMNAPSAEQLDELYGRPSATPEQTDRMTYEDTIQKAVGAFAILAVGAAIGWFVPALAIPAAIVGFVLALVNIFKKKTVPALVLAYSAVQGVFVGGISQIFEQTNYQGIATQALIGTAAVFIATLLLFRSGKIRASKKATKIFLIAMVGYALFGLVNLGLMVFGVTDSQFGLRDMTFLGMPLGLILGVLVVLLAAYSLVLDFDAVKQGVENGAPRTFAWRAVFGIVLTVVWLYIEILRILAILRGGE
ncbi:putative YccA/Bax inhibitor family protein [Microcella putealis]|uniref:Putative YccA/Bax inhibitor family protein n=2 Tax=Microcella putealis TaxID=337005 RepID=A0A4V2EWM7_9MICO|nr:Bax inhibitor-1/YccA family protein [Microcella putealis]RZS56530.1 putative YccA/Bax inhibitor family protein [Microcella putealis]TQM26984.1 putative YccA/Bax inhibitor family protein [Microcella putealis]